MEDYPILAREHLLTDLKSFSAEEVSALCEETRRFLIDKVTQNGGHLASNLGMTEAAIALHKNFHSPEDKIIFDVSHQCYAHKLLTGRFESFSTLRKKNGISGFTNREEN